MKKILMTLVLAPVMALAIEPSPSYTPEAVAKYKEKADAGDAEAQFLYARALSNGEGVRRDTKSAFEYAKRSADQGYELSYRMVGMGYDYGYGVKTNASEAAVWYGKFLDWAKPFAEKGDVWAQFQLGLCLQYGNGVAKNAGEAAKWYRKAADQGSAPAQNQLGYCYQDGQGVETNFAEAVSLFRKSAEQGEVGAQLALAHCCMSRKYSNLMRENGMKGKKGEEEALFWYRKAADQGNAWAQTRVGEFYEGGRGVKRDPAEGIRWFRKAADSGYDEAQCILGLRYIQGIGVETNYAESVKWYRKAAAQGSWSAFLGQSALGMCYENGWGVPMDKAEAVKWYLKAAAQDWGSASYHLAICYATGDGVKRDLKEAAKWYGKYAKQPYRQAGDPEKEDEGYSGGFRRPVISEAEQVAKAQRSYDALASLGEEVKGLSPEIKAAYDKDLGGAKLRLERAEKRYLRCKESAKANVAAGMSVVAQKLLGCDFLVNEQFKQNAKFYLCLYSASWCGPCRKEMPRIAKTYAEKLKADPDIELIHFSWDQNDEKAMSWAKEHDVKFPVVAPDGGNPLNLDPNGIPHLYILKADGTLLEEGHPNRLFNEEKILSLKGWKRRPATLLGKVAAKTEKVGDYTWSFTVNNGEATISTSQNRRLVKHHYDPCAISPSPTGHVSIPSTLGGVKVTRIGAAAFRDCTNMTSVTIPTSVKSIEIGAFSGCKGLTSIDFPEGLKSIGWNAFSGCAGLKSVTIPANVDNIMKGAFSNCDELRQINFSADNPKYASVDGVLYTKDMTQLVQCPAGLASVTIPESVTVIGDQAFDGCRRMTTVTIPSGVTSIRGSAFKGCTGLTSVTIPQKVHSIGWLAFAGCHGLASVTMCGVQPVAQKGVFGFQGQKEEKQAELLFCQNLKSIHVPADSKNWAGMSEWQGIPLVFDGASLDPQKEKELQDAVQQESARREKENARREAERAEQKKKLQEIQSKHKRIKAEKAAAANCATNSTEEEKNVMAERLAKCIYLLNGEFKRNAKVYICLFATTDCGVCRSEMQRIAKAYADNLKDDPDIEVVEVSLDRYEKRALDWAKAHDVKFPITNPTSFKNAESIDLPVFSFPHLFIVRADGVILDDGHPASTFTEAKLRDLKSGRLMPPGRNPDIKDGPNEAVVDGHTWSFTVQNGEAKIELRRPKMLGGLCAVSPSLAGDITIPSVLGGVKVTGIGRSAFKGCGELKSVTIPPSIWDIGGWPFHGCNKLESVTIQSDVIRLSEGCLSCCAGLKQINVGPDNRVYASLDGLLYTKDRTELVQCPAGLTSVDIQKDVTSIGNYAFNGCQQLTVVTLPPHTKSIGVCAFRQCTGLKTITVPSDVRYIGGCAFAECEGLTTVVMQGECPSSPKDVFENCANLKSIHVPASSKNWAGMKEWLGIPLVFDAE